MYAAGPSVRPFPRGLVMDLADVEVRLLATGALWWPGAGALVVSDLHLEKGSALAARGQMAPPYDTRETLRRLGELVDALNPAIVVSLGDSFHDRQAHARMAPDDVDQLRGLTARSDWVWIEGNHDPAPPTDMGGRRRAELRIGELVFRHEPAAAPQPGEVCGHLHPCARVSGRGRSVRTRCFATDGERLVMPAFGALTGGLNVLDAAFAPVFPNGLTACVMGRDSVYAAAAGRLVPDVVRLVRAAG